MKLLTPRWYPLDPHKVQGQLWSCGKRFRCAHAGRRSGKTELAMRRLVLKAIECDKWDGRFVGAAPTRPQAKQIYWRHLKALVPNNLKAATYETALEIHLVHGPRIQVIGMDVPERVEGSPLDGIVLDEYANMKSSTWEEHVQGALVTRGRPPGWAWFIGVPEGRNHYYELCQNAARQDKAWEDWASFTWFSSDVIDPAEVAKARETMDPIVFSQEYEGSFISFQGRAYYRFDREINCRALKYNKELPLIFAFDFNVSPGVAAVLQEQQLDENGPDVTCVIGEVWIKRGSNTPMVCRKLIEDWSHHQHDVLCYGDATGGLPGSAKIAGSDWDLIKNELRQAFGPRLKFRVPKGNPKERPRVNSVNGRLRAIDGKARLLVDPFKCPKTVQDFDGVRVIEGSAGELDKKSDPMLTHLSDAVGYYVHRKHPLAPRIATSTAV
jgi:hypothetical protein